MIHSLNEDELDIAARCSYRYFQTVLQSKNPPTAEWKELIALTMARLHFVAHKRNYDKALSSMKNT